MNRNWFRIPSSVALSGLIMSILIAILRGSELLDVNLDGLLATSLIATALGVLGLILVAIWDNTPRPY